MAAVATIMNVLTGPEMNNPDLDARIESLEARLMHQESAIDELTRTLLLQEQVVSRQAATIERLEAQLRSMFAASITPPGEDEPPPHY
jgi:SlyX protein